MICDSRRFFCFQTPTNSKAFAQTYLWNSGIFQGSLNLFTQCNLDISSRIGLTLSFGQNISCSIQWFSYKIYDRYIEWDVGKSYQMRCNGSLFSRTLWKTDQSSLSFLSTNTLIPTLNWASASRGALRMDFRKISIVGSDVFNTGIWELWTPLKGR